MNENRVYCLYRVSTNKQVDYDEQNTADIPMQRLSKNTLKKVFSIYCWYLCSTDSAENPMKHRSSLNG